MKHVIAYLSILSKAKTLFSKKKDYRPNLLRHRSWSLALGSHLKSFSDEFTVTETGLEWNWQSLVCGFQCHSL